MRTWSRVFLVVALLWTTLLGTAHAAEDPDRMRAEDKEGYPGLVPYMENSPRAITKEFVEWVNGNFDLIARFARIGLVKCVNAGPKLSVSFEDSLNENLEKIGWKLNLNLPRVGDFDETLIPFYNVVNDAFHLIEDKLGHRVRGKKNSSCPFCRELASRKK